MEQRILKMKNAKVREADGKKYLEGYFAVFNEPYEVFPGWIETISPGAFSRYLESGKDTKVLWNHNPDIVLGSTGNGTAQLREDTVGLFGSVEINALDQDAVNAYARVERGDVDGCSFGFDIAREDDWWDDDGVWHTKIMEVDPLYEVSPCTFPAYASTSISARNKDKLAGAKSRSAKEKEKAFSAWKEKVLSKVKGEK